MLAKLNVLISHAIAEVPQPLVELLYVTTPSWQAQERQLYHRLNMISIHTAQCQHDAQEQRPKYNHTDNQRTHMPLHFEWHSFHHDYVDDTMDVRKLISLV